jgi:hypothetical protein
MVDAPVWKELVGFRATSDRHVGTELPQFQSRPLSRLGHVFLVGGAQIGVDVLTTRMAVALKFNPLGACCPHRHILADEQRHQ